MLYSSILSTLARSRAPPIGQPLNSQLHRADRLSLVSKRHLTGCPELPATGLSSRKDESSIKSWINTILWKFLQRFKIYTTLPTLHLCGFCDFIFTRGTGKQVLLLSNGPFEFTHDQCCFR